MYTEFPSAENALQHRVELNCRQHEAELRQSREECWAREQELATGREKLVLLKATLEDRRKDIVSYKVTNVVGNSSVST